MEWDNEKVFALIAVYRDHPVLWNCALPEYKNRNKRSDALNVLSLSLGVEKSEIERKIKNLMSHFTRELRREANSERYGSRRKRYKSKWFAYESMTFLRSRNRPKPRNTTDTDEIEEPETSDEAMPNDGSDAEETNIKVQIQPFPMHLEKRYKRDTDDAKLDKDFDISTAASTQQEQDESQAFGILVAKKMSKYSCGLQSLVQQDIMNILFKADTTHLSDYSVPYLSNNSSFSHPPEFPNSQLSNPFPL